MTTTNLLQVTRLDGLQHMHIPAGQQYQSPGEAYVEGDASSASYFLAGDCLQQDTLGLCGCGLWPGSGATHGSCSVNGIQIIIQICQKLAAACFITALSCC